MTEAYAKSNLHSIKLYIVNSTGSVCTYGEVRLVGGNDEYEGRVEVCVENGWHTVCDDGWGAEEAKVVCHQLGYSYTGGKYILCICYIGIIIIVLSIFV